MESIIIIPKKLLIMRGIWPKQDPSILYITKETVGDIGEFILFLIMTKEVIDCLGDFIKLSASLFLFTTFLSFMVKYLSYRLNYSTLFEVLKSFDDPLFDEFPTDLNRYVEKGASKMKILSRFYRTCVTCCVSFFGIFPLLDGQPLPIQSAYFNAGPLHYPFYIFQWVFLGVNAWSNLSLDLIMVGLMQVSVTQLEILREKLIRTDKYAKLMYNNSNDGVVQYLLHCSMHYDKIIEFVNNVEKIFTIGLFAQFAGSIIVICNTGFNFLLVPLFSSQFFTLLLYFIVMMSQLMMYCWFGNEIILGSTEIGEACYMSSWYNFDSRSKKILFLMMERSKRPLSISTYKLSNLSLTAFTNILHWSYSYFTLLRRLYNGD